MSCPDNRYHIPRWGFRPSFRTRKGVTKASCAFFHRLPTFSLKKRYEGPRKKVEIRVLWIIFITTLLPKGKAERCPPLTSSLGKGDTVDHLQGIPYSLGVMAICVWRHRRNRNGWLLWRRSDGELLYCGWNFLEKKISECFPRARCGHWKQWAEKDFHWFCYSQVHLREFAGLWRGSW